MGEFRNRVAIILNSASRISVTFYCFSRPFNFPKDSYFAKVEVGSILLVDNAHI